MALSDLQKLIRAYNLLAASCDDQRALVGTVSRSWIASEIERDIPLSEISKGLLASVRGRDILAKELFPDADVDPASVDPFTTALPDALADIRINSNRLPKLEPTINAAVLAGTVLLGVQRYGNKGKGREEIEHDLIVAALIVDCIGRRHYHSALLTCDCVRIDDAMIESTLGAEVLAHVAAIRAYETAFAHALEQPDEVVANIPPAYANVIAARALGHLRLSARAAGDQIISTLDDAKLDELRSKGINTDGEFPERVFLEHDYRIAQAALALPGIDHAALREPIESTLMMAVGDVLEDAGKVRRLVGRRGKAIHDVHNNLPMLEYYDATEHPNDIATVHVAALELMRYLDKCRRKAYNTMLAHAFHIAGAIEASLGASMQPRLASMALLHDVVEDGSHSVAGYDQSLHKLRLRFGGPLAAMVAELTDSQSHLDGEKKAQLTLQWPHIAQPEKQYNVDRFSTMHLQPTDGEQPYTLEGIVVKLCDTAVTFEEGIRNPELMSGWWRHSGARIYWAQCTRGAIVNPLIERLHDEILDSETAMHYFNADTALSREMIQCLRHLLRNVMLWADRYTTMNLSILSNEFALDDHERSALFTAFFDRDMTPEVFSNNFVESMLTDERLADQVKRGALPDKSFVTLYRYCEDKPAERDLRNFIAYRQSALWRMNIREQLKCDWDVDRAEADRDIVLELYRQCLRDSHRKNDSHAPQRTHSQR
ncbi:MAG: hypothetical protein AAF434_09385 [Pseudomonadota bacterium]